ncbi:hypothetical protein Tco_1047287 [Tanacetum coccineum]
MQGIPAAYHNLGPPSYECPGCHAIMWYEKRNDKAKRVVNPTFSLCCQEGKVLLLRLNETPPPLKQLLDYKNTTTLRSFWMAKEWCHSNPSNDFGLREPSRDVIVNKNNSGLQRISKLHPSYMALQYPLLFSYGEDGFHEKIPYHRNTGERKTKRGGDTSAAGLGKRIVCPRSFTGGPRNPAEIDDIISAELPSLIDDLEGYKVVTEYMLHSPCGADAKYIPCITDGTCSKHFPKSFLAETVIDEDGYALYRWRNNKVTARKGDFVYYNKHVVPYNRYLLLKYQAHINVEWCNRSKSIKYLFKYLNKGPDRATVVI